MPAGISCNAMDMIIIYKDLATQSALVQSSNENCRTIFEISSKLTKKTAEQCHCRPCIFSGNFEQI